MGQSRMRQSQLERGADYVIAGAGSAGCVLARRLAQTGASVILLEAGGPDRTRLVRKPGMIAIFHNVPALKKRLDWGYYTAPQASALGRRIPQPPAADAVRRRPGRPPARARHRRGRRPAGRRQPARPHVRADDLLHDLGPQPGHHTILRDRGRQGSRPRRHLDGPNGLRSRWFRPQPAGPGHTGYPGPRAAVVVPVPQPGLAGQAEDGQALCADHHAHADLPEEPRHPPAGLGRPGRRAGHRPRLPDRTRRQPPAARRDRADPRDDGQHAHRGPGQPGAQSRPRLR
jgi:hypothetical protein